MEEILLICELIYIRVYDVFKLWEICKCIDNYSLDVDEIEMIVFDMFFEIVELLLDYFGNMVV